MRLLFVGTGRGGGGTENYMVALAGAMAERGHEVAAVVRPGGAIERELATGGRGVRVFHGSFERSNDPAGAATVWRATRHFRPDWIVGSFKREYLAVSFVARAQGTRAALFKHIVNMHPASARLLPRIADRFIVPSAYLREVLVRRGAPVDRVHLLPNPVDVRRFAPEAELRQRMREELGVGEDEVLVGFVGRLESSKGVHTYADALEEAMTRCQRIRSLWVGDGEAAAPLLERLWRSPHRTRHAHLGWVADVRPCYAAMDLLALPSTGPEAFGRVSIEAQAFGIPVLGSDSGGIPETLVNGQTGVLLPPGNASAWAEALIRLAEGPSVRSSMSGAARDFVVQRFCQERVARDFEALLDA